MLIYGGDAIKGKARYQGSKESQALCDSAIMLFPSFADSYYIKAIPFLKRGEFGLWKTIIDKAVEYDSLLYLGYRGGAQFMFLRNYEGAIKDIETLKSIYKSDIGAIYNGEYHLEIIRSLSYKGLGDTIQAIKILEDHIIEYEAGLYGYYHLGVMYFEENRYLDAIKTFLKQSASYDFADLNYFIGLSYKNIGEDDKYKKAIQKAYDLYLEGRMLCGNGSFMDYPDKVYLKQIKKAMIQ
jgi:tetratricopeptide (TPR) repeat protein